MGHHRPHRLVRGHRGRRVSKAGPVVLSPHVFLLTLAPLCLQLLHDGQTWRRQQRRRNRSLPTKRCHRHAARLRVVVTLHRAWRCWGVLPRGLGKMLFSGNLATDRTKLRARVLLHLRQDDRAWRFRSILFCLEGIRVAWRASSLVAKRSERQLLSSVALQTWRWRVRWC